MLEPVQFLCSTWQEVMPAYEGRADLVICDPMYESKDLSWVAQAAACLRPGGSLYAFGDHHRVAETKLELDRWLEFQNWVIWGPNDWGGRSKKRYGQKHDDILFYSKRGAECFFDAGAIAIPKQMLGKTFNPSGRETKIPNSVWTELSGFSTTSSERVKIRGHAARWQKPKKVIERLVKASCPRGGLVLDFFGGVATVPVVCAVQSRMCVSTECGEEQFLAGAARLEQTLSYLRTH